MLLRRVGLHSMQAVTREKYGQRAADNDAAFVAIFYGVGQRDVTVS
jgi:hypothetical protein